MKTTKKINKLMVAATIMMITLSSCATKAPFLHSTVVPAATGSVMIQKDKNNNFKVKVQLVNIAASDKLDPPRATYIVWMVTGDQPAKNMGLIKSSSPALSHSLKASFETVTPLKPHKIFITAEDDGNVATPGDQMILTTGDL